MHTVCAIAYVRIQCANKFCEDGIDVVEAGEYGDDVGAWVRIPLGEDAREENAECLSQRQKGDCL
jgi:hypothetical protein